MTSLPRWLRLGFPSLCFAMGIWQMCRYRIKRKMIDNYLCALEEPSLELAGISQIEPNKLFSLKACMIDTDRAIWIGPRAHNSRFEYIVVAPLSLPDGEEVLLNAGWSSRANTFPALADAINAVMDCRSETAPWHSPQMPTKNTADLAERLGTAPLMLKTVKKDDQVPFANRHVEYIVTWFSVGILTLVLGRRTANRNHNKLY